MNGCVTGDLILATPALNALRETFPQAQIDVLKVGHHGSKTSSTEPFLAAASPSFALISAGKDNLFHHPHPDVVERLAAHNVRTFRSDELGLVTIRSDGKRFAVSINRYPQ